MNTIHRRIIRAVALSMFAIIIATQCQPRGVRYSVPPPPLEMQTVKTGFVYYFPQAHTFAVQPARTQKKGLAVTEWRPTDAARVGATWCYNWSPGGKPCGDDVEFIAMIWCADVPAYIAPSRKLAGANEPDQPSQCNKSPREYVATWRMIEERFGDRALIAPVPSQEHLDWLLEFRREYIEQVGAPPRFDYLAMHCYVSHAEHCIAILDFYTRLVDEWGIAGGVIVTEFAIFPCLNPSGYLAEARKLIEHFEDEPRVAGYAWFANAIDETAWWWYGLGAACNSQLLRPDGTYSEIGRMYAEK
jgi:hypothetical protein